MPQTQATEPFKAPIDESQIKMQWHHVTAMESGLPMKFPDGESYDLIYPEISIPRSAFRTTPNPYDTGNKAVAVRVESTIGVMGTGLLDAITEDDIKAQYASTANYYKNIAKVANVSEYVNPNFWDADANDFATGAWYTATVGAGKTADGGEGKKMVKRFTYALTRATLQDGPGANAIWNITNVTRPDRPKLYTTTAWADAMAADKEVIEKIKKDPTSPYLAKAIDIAKKYFSNVKIEVMPLSTEDYKTLADHGMNGVICFQETYHRDNYKLYHPRGMKSKFEWRCDGFDRMGMAGVHSIGMGVLIGLEKEWRTDVVMMAHHLRYLQKHYWKTKYSVNFPRMRPAQNEGFQPNCFMTDKQLAQATFAMRIFDHDVDISYSTREPAYIRDNMATLGVTTMSAESKVNPGGYHTYPQALEQFTVSDERTAKVINARLKELGREPVWKDWDASFDFFGNVANG